MTTILQNISTLSIVLPLLMGFLSFLAKDRYCRVLNILYLTLFSGLFLFVACSTVHLDLQSGREVLDVIGHWPKAIGIETKFNFRNASVVLALEFVFIIFFALNLRDSVGYRFRGFICIMLCGATGMALTNDVFNAYVFFEIVCITTYIVYAYGEKAGGIKNAYNYMIISSFAGVVFLIVICFLYQITGNLNISLIHNILSSASGNKTIDACFILFVLIMAVKLGVYPFHGITVGIYKNLPINYLMVATGVSSIVYPSLVLKITTDLFGSNFFLRNEYLGVCMSILGGTGFLFCNLVALFSNHFLRFVIFLSLGNTALFIFCLPYVSSSNVVIGLYLSVISNTILKVCLLGIIFSMTKAIGMDDFKKSSIKYFSKWSCKFPIVILLFFISGMPISLVFFSKIYILFGVLNIAGSVLRTLTLVSGFVIEIFACFSVIKDALAKSKEGDILYRTNLPVTFYVVMYFIILLIVCLSFGNIAFFKSLF